MRLNFVSKYIVIEGPIGVGKTTLAKKIADSLNYKVLLETFFDNPFLLNFYKNQREFALATQLQFLLNRSKVFSKERKDFFASNNVISDFLMKKNKLFSEIILNQDELSLYNNISYTLDFYEPKPDLVIYLQADINILLNRIQKRGEIYEYQITSDYLGSIVNAYAKYFHSYEESPLLVINTSNVDVNKPDDYSLLLEVIKKDLKGKNYFNPSGA
tara:strand:- start:2627 stop:3271 length:645 start_codon:yes stop_codon:yes gene_type:complete